MRSLDPNIARAMADDAPWKKLVSDLRARKHDSVYLDRLAARLPNAVFGDTRNDFDALQAEIVAETAAALGRAEDKVNVALLKLELTGREIDVLETDRVRNASALAAKYALHESQREEARLALHHFTIHREAVGLVCDDFYWSLYPIPRRRSR